MYCTAQDKRVAAKQGTELERAQDSDTVSATHSHCPVSLKLGPLFGGSSLVLRCAIHPHTAQKKRCSASNAGVQSRYLHKMHRIASMHCIASVGGRRCVLWCSDLPLLALSQVPPRPEREPPQALQNCCKGVKQQRRHSPEQEPQALQKGGCILALISPLQARMSEYVYSV